MSTTRDEIEVWLYSAPEEADYMFVVREKEEESFPIYCSGGREYDRAYAKYSKGAYFIAEIYNLHISFNEQLGEGRAWHPYGEKDDTPL